jgi:serine/threonine-protein kinase
MSHTREANTFDDPHGLLRPTEPAPPSSRRFGLAPGEQPMAGVRTELPDLERIGAGERYEEGPILGEGGMGVVWLQRDRTIGRYVAQKRLHPFLTSAKTQRRFVREARAQGQLEHPAIVPVYDLGRDPRGQLFFTMKRVHGLTLARVLGGLADGDADLIRRFPRRRLLTAFIQVCRAIHYAHARHVLHRDLKPSNVMIGDFGEVYVLDWGLARVLDETPFEPAETERTEPITPPPAGSFDAPRTDPDAAVELSRLTVDDGVAAGTPGYMAPEQLSGETLDARTDVYALGIILYEILTRRRFREDPSLLKLAMEITEGRVARPSDVDPDADPDLDAICVRATAKAPDGRFASAGELADAIERVLDGERDSQARAEAASRHFARAKDLLASPREAGHAERKARAMHELLRAVTLDPTAEQARTLLVTLLSDGSDAPPGAKDDLDRARQAHRAEGTTATMFGMIAWLLPAPIILSLVSVRSWPEMLMAIVPCVIVLALSIWARRAPRISERLALVVAALMSVVIVSLSAIMGPFVVGPTAATASAMFFAMYVSRRERGIATAMFTTAVLLPFLLDALGIGAPSFSVERDHVTLFARAVDLPPVITPLALAWSAGSFTALAAWMTGRMHDRLERAEERLTVSAWHLRQLFAPEETEP